jgi:hypothetical protein
MVFISKNLKRKCKYCDNEPKKNFSSGRNKGYYRTCGSETCLKKQYTDAYVNRKKGTLNKEAYGICQVCQEKFTRTCSGHKFYCKICVPSKSWRARARRYKIGKPQWDELIEKQNGTCALCERNPEVVDHRPGTNVATGLLCNKCNVYIKLLDMEIEYVRKAMKYIGFNYGV